MLYSYDVRMEEAVLRALTLLDASRHKEMLCEQRLEQVKLLVLKEEQAAAAQQQALQLEHLQQEANNLTDTQINDALENTVLRGLEAGVDGVRHLAAEGDDQEAGADDTPSSAGLLQGAYDKLVAVAMHATSSVAACEVATSPGSVGTADYNLSMELASAYADLRDAQQDTERHRVLLQELEMLVEPVLNYRHAGVYDPAPYSSHDGFPPSAPPLSLPFLKSSHPGGEGLCIHRMHSMRPLRRAFA